MKFLKLNDCWRGKNINRNCIVPISSIKQIDCEPDDDYCHLEIILNDGEKYLVTLEENKYEEFLWFLKSKETFFEFDDVGTEMMGISIRNFQTNYNNSKVNSQPPVT